jgi:hypothetical protein
MPQQLTENAVDVRIGSGRESLYRRDALICAFLMAGCLLLAHPFLEMGFVDDWSYIKTTEVFARTGHFVYNGWATASLGWQVLWGALFSKLLGFSFVHVRLSTLPVAMASVCLFHQILVRFGISRGNAIFGSLCLALSPPFLAMSASYMTDVPGLFCTFLCLYLCQQAISANADRIALAWLCVAAVTNLAGGTVRQTAWLGVLVIVPSALWLLRKRSLVLWGGTSVWVFSAAGVFGLMRWFDRQPYFLAPRIPAHFLGVAELRYTVLREAAHASQALLCTLLLLLPLLVAWWPVARFAPRRRLSSLFAIASVLLTVLLAEGAAHGILDYFLAPWLPGVMEYIATGYTVIPGLRPASLGEWQRIAITACVLATALVFFVNLCSGLRNRKQLTGACATTRSQIFWLLVPFTIVYFGTLIIRGVSDPWFDRYLIPLQTVGIVFLLRYYEDFVAKDHRATHAAFGIGSLPAVSSLALLVFAYAAVAGTHDWFAVYRARLQAAEELRRAGVPRTAIQAGFEYDGWTQIEDGGYINDPRLRVPPDAFRAVAPSAKPVPECAATWFGGNLTPSITPEYFIVYSPVSCLDPAPFPAVPYRRWMPPFTGRIYVQKRKS